MFLTHKGLMVVSGAGTSADSKASCLDCICPCNFF